MTQPQWTPLPPPAGFETPPPYYGAMPPAPPPQKPSSGYKALGIVMGCLGVGGVLWAFFSAGSLALVGAYAHASSLYGSETFIFGFVRAFMSIVTGAMLAVAGFGVYRAKKWSRILGVAYAGLSLFDTLAGTAINLLVVQPRTFARLGAARGFASVELFTYISAAFGVLIMCALPVVVMVALLRSRAKLELDA